MAPTIEKISAITLRVLNMKASVQFYRNVLGTELLMNNSRSSVFTDILFLPVALALYLALREVSKNIIGSAGGGNATVIEICPKDGRIRIVCKQ
jgi:catechol 2,3-dioxygenase-like lactoylglutathione lyase family enzyme